MMVEDEERKKIAAFLLASARVYRKASENEAYGVLDRYAFVGTASCLLQIAGVVITGKYELPPLPQGVENQEGEKR